MKKSYHFFRNTFLAGLFTILPIFLTFVIFAWLFTNFTSFLLPYILQLEKIFEIELNYTIRRLLSLVLLCFIIFIIGLFAKNYFGKRFISIFEHFLEKIPIIRSVYSSIKQMINAFQNTNKENFSKVVLVEYPRKGMYSIGFLTNENINFLSDVLSFDMCSVFIPTTPNPTSGYLLMVPTSDVVKLDLTIEEGAKILLTAALWNPEEPDEKTDKK